MFMLLKAFSFVLLAIFANFKYSPRLTDTHQGACLAQAFDSCAKLTPLLF